MLPKLTRSQKILAAVAVVLVALYVTGITVRNDSEPADPSQNALARKLGSWFGSPDPVSPQEITATCYADGKLTIKSACTLTVSTSDQDLRNLYLVPDKPLKVTARAPHDDVVVEKESPAGEQLKVAVDGDGGTVTLTCDECTVKVGE